MGGAGAKKGAIEMDPPDPSSINKRRRKNTHVVALPLNEGLKRTMSAKTPSPNNMLSSSENTGIVYNQGRWTSLEHFKFLEALKKFGKEWQKVQQHVSTRTSTQARSHAQKFFVKLDKKNLTLEEFLKDLDLKEVEKTLLAAGNDNIDYDEEREVNMIANKKLRGSVMNIALPTDGEDKKRLDLTNPNKRTRSEVDSYKSYEHPNESNSRPVTARVSSSTKEAIRKAFEQHEVDEENKDKSTKRFKTSEKGEYGMLPKTKNILVDEKPCSEATAITNGTR
jgi:SHAQKYF class myb-like DNA-binding protein